MPLEASLVYLGRMAVEQRLMATAAARGGRGAFGWHAVHRAACRANDLLRLGMVTSLRWLL